MKNAKLKIILLSAGFALLVASSCNAKNPAGKTANRNTAAQAWTAPDFTLKTLEGKSLTLSSLLGKIIILDFFATWCPPCRAEIPSFIQLQKSYKDKGVVVLGVSLDTCPVSKVRDFAKNMKINYSIVMGNEKTAGDFGGISGIPTTFIINKEGKISQKYVGCRDKDVFEKEILNLLK